MSVQYYNSTCAGINEVDDYEIFLMLDEKIQSHLNKKSVDIGSLQTALKKGKKKNQEQMKNKKSSRTKSLIDRVSDAFSYMRKSLAQSSKSNEEVHEKSEAEKVQSSSSSSSSSENSGSNSDSSDSEKVSIHGDGKAAKFKKSMKKVDTPANVSVSVPASVSASYSADGTACGGTAAITEGTESGFKSSVQGGVYAVVDSERESDEGNGGEEGERYRER